MWKFQNYITDNFKNNFLRGKTFLKLRVSLYLFLIFYSSIYSFYLFFIFISYIYYFVYFLHLSLMIISYSYLLFLFLMFITFIYYLFSFSCQIIIFNLKCLCLYVSLYFLYFLLVYIFTTVRIWSSFTPD